MKNFKAQIFFRCKKSGNNLLILLFISYSFAVNAQVTFKGRVIDKETGLPVAYANVTSMNAGVYSNADGVFEFSYQEKKPGVNIKISCVGFNTVSLLQDTIKSNIEYNIFLEQHTTQLSEVIVEGKKEKIDATEIVSMAIKKIESYPKSEEYVSEVFFRQTHFFEVPAQKKIEYLRYLEAGILIQHEKENSQTVIIKEVRRSDDNRKKYFLDDRDKENLSEEQRFQFSEYFLQLDYTRNDVPLQREYKNVYSLLDPAIGNLNNDFLSRHTFKFEKVTRYEDENVYVIEILPSKKSTEVENELLKNQFIPAGKLFISGDDYSILEIQYSFIQNPKKTKKDVTEIVKLMNQGHSVFQDIIRYKRFNGRMYPAYIMREQADTIFMGGFANSGLTQNTQTEKDFGYFKIRRELLVSNVFLDKSEIDKIDLTPKYFSLYPRNYMYNAKFWNTYNKLIPSKTENDLLRDLGNGKSLEEQFIENGMVK